MGATEARIPYVITVGVTPLLRRYHESRRCQAQNKHTMTQNNEAILHFYSEIVKKRSCDPDFGRKKSREVQIISKLRSKNLLEKSGPLLRNPH